MRYRNDSPHVSRGSTLINMRRLLTAAALLFCSLSAFAQLGSIDFPATGKAEARPAFLRGVAALHSFWYDEAADAFREAEKIDPDFALAYWGEAMTYNHPIWMEVDLDAGRRALAKPGASKAKTPREHAWLDAVSALYGEGEKKTRDLAYEQAMDRLASTYPDDVEAQIFHALAILGTRENGENDPRKQIRAAAILEPIYTTHPDHPGVLHYLIHAYDDPLHAPLGLRAAQRYARVAPAAFHALHMPSHIFLQLGMWRETIASNEASYATSKEWAGRKHLGRAKRDLHSLQWLQYAYLQSGRPDDAKKLLAEVASAEGEDARERITRTNMLARYAIETGDWSILPKMTASAPADGDSQHAGCASKSYTGDSSPLAFAIGLAAVSADDLKAAKDALDQLHTLREAKKEVIQKRVIDVMSKELEAKIESGSRALELAAEAVAIEDALGPPSGPPDTFKPAHELYGELLMNAGKTKEAYEQFSLALLRTPNRRASLVGAAKTKPPEPVAFTAAYVDPALVQT